MKKFISWLVVSVFLFFYGRKIKEAIKDIAANYQPSRVLVSLVFIPLVALTLAGCEFRFQSGHPSMPADSSYKEESSEDLYEDAVVADTVFSPPRHEVTQKTEIRYDWRLEGNGHYPAVVPTKVSIPATYGLLFECQHGKFYIESKRLFETLKKGQKVRIKYQEVYKVRRNAEGHEVSKEFVKFDFIDAAPAEIEKGGK